MIVDRAKRVCTGDDVRHSSSQVTDPVHVYFDKLSPGSRHPSTKTVVLLHGGSHTGACFLVTPDGRPGWAPLFASRGYTVVVPDLPGHGRSGHPLDGDLTGALVCSGIAALISALGEQVVLVTHSMSGPYGWRVAEVCQEQVVAVVGVSPGPPGNIQRMARLHTEDDSEVTVQTETGMRRLRKHKRTTEVETRAALAVLVGDSSRFPRERVSGYGRSLGSSGFRLIYERMNVEGSQLKLDDPSKLAGKPILVVTGTHDATHPRSYDEATVRWFRFNGAMAEHMYLGDFGISGNGHMLMLEENSDEIANLIMNWLDRAT